MGGPCDYCVTPVPIGLGFGFWTVLGLGLGLRGPDLGLGLDNKRHQLEMHRIRLLKELMIKFSWVGIDWGLGLWLINSIE